MGWLSSILRVLAPIAVEHGGQVLRDSLRSRAAQQEKEPELSGPDPIEQVAADVEQLKTYAAQLKSDFDALNNSIAEREERLRKWLLALLIWNAVVTLGLIVVAVFALKR